MCNVHSMEYYLKCNRSQDIKKKKKDKSNQEMSHSESFQWDLCQFDNTANAGWWKSNWIELFYLVSLILSFKLSLPVSPFLRENFEALWQKMKPLLWQDKNTVYLWHNSPFPAHKFWALAVMLLHTYWVYVAKFW